MISTRAQPKTLRDANTRLPGGNSRYQGLVQALASFPSRRSRQWRLRPSLALLGTCALLLGGGGLTEEAAAHEPAVAVGAYVAGAETDGASVDDFSRAAEREPVLISYYRQWDSRAFENRTLDAVWSRGSVPFITWEPHSYEGGEFPLRLIQSGRYDPYIRRSAEEARVWGKPILVRFMHEMNGDWYPWGRSVGNNNAELLKEAWRHVVGIFREEGASNVEWVWTPNVNTDGALPFADLYPGDRWVDWVGLDGYNGTEDQGWSSFTEIFGDSYEEITHLSRRPVIVAETGSGEAGGDKAQWITSLLGDELPQFARIRAFIWFNHDFDGIDVPIESSENSLRAFRDGLAPPFYGLDRERFLATPKNLVGGAAAPEEPSSGFGQPADLAERLDDRLLWVAIGIGIAALIAGGLRVLGRRRVFVGRPGSPEEGGA
jgi:Glycosyl hydrolase family 26